MKARMPLTCPHTPDSSLPTSSPDKQVPFYRTYVNGVWTGIWFGVLYTALLLVYIAFGHHKSVDQRRVVTLVRGCLDGGRRKGCVHARVHLVACLPCLCTARYRLGAGALSSCAVSTNFDAAIV